MFEVTVAPQPYLCQKILGLYTGLEKFFHCVYFSQISKNFSRVRFNKVFLNTHFNEIQLSAVKELKHFFKKASK